MLEWNSDTEMYEAIVDGKLVQVSNDEFAEAEEHHAQTYKAQGMDEESAENKARDEVRWASGWADSHAVTHVKLKGDVDIYKVYSVSKEGWVVQATNADIPRGIHDRK